MRLRAGKQACCSPLLRTPALRKILDFIEANLQGRRDPAPADQGPHAGRHRADQQHLDRVRPASFRKLRGPIYVAIIADELAFWFTDSAFVNPDIEVLAAARPGLLTTRGMLIMASSPYAKMGVLWDTFRKHYGPDGAAGVLVAKGGTRDFNQTIPQAEIDRELERDRVRNTAELLAEFRGDLESYITPLRWWRLALADYPDWLPLRARALPRVHRMIVSRAGSGAGDSFTLAISHRDGEQVVIDCILARCGRRSRLIRSSSTS